MMSHFRNEVNFTPFTEFEEDYRLYQQIEKVSLHSIPIIVNLILNVKYM